MERILSWVTLQQQVADFFILTFKSLGVSEPADNSVTSAKIVDGAIVNADINASAAIAVKYADFCKRISDNRYYNNRNFKLTESDIIISEAAIC